MRGDNCPETDGLITKENIIGCVTRVERRGRRVRLGFGEERALIAALNRGNGLTRIRQLCSMPRRAAVLALRCLQGQATYRAIGRRLAPPFSVGEADETDLIAVHHKLNPFAPYQNQPRNPNVMNWVARRGNAIIGFVQYVHHSGDNNPWVGHWLFTLHVWAPYRGLGVGEALTRRVIHHAEEHGAPELFLAVEKSNARAIRLYQKLGFEMATLHSLEPLFIKEEQKLGRRRIVMRRALVNNS